MITGSQIVQTNNKKLLDVKAYIDEVLYKENQSFEVTLTNDEDGNDLYSYQVMPNQYGLIAWSPKEDVFVGFFIDWRRENWYIQEGFTPEFIETGAPVWMNKTDPDEFLKALIIKDND